MGTPAKESQLRQLAIDTVVRHMKKNTQNPTSVYAIISEIKIATIDDADSRDSTEN